MVPAEVISVIDKAIDTYDVVVVGGGAAGLSGGLLLAAAQAEQLAAIGQAIGRELRWEELPRQAALEALAAAWGDPAFAETAVDAWEWFVDHPETVTSAVQDITGTPARRFADWAAANAAAFR